MSSPLTIGIAGAGLLGRLLAWHLARAGHAVSVFDPAASAQPVPRSQAADPYVPTAAGFTAAGMLSPLAELDNAEAPLAALGWRSISLWQAVAAALGQPQLLHVGGSLLVAHRADAGAAQRVLDRLRAACATPEWRQASPPQGVQPLHAAALRALEPAIQGPAHAWLLPGEGFIHPIATLSALHDQAPGVAWHWGQPVRAVQARGGSGALHLADGRVLGFDWVIDVRGVGARPDAPQTGESAVEARAEAGAGHTPPAFSVRGVRGEVIWLDCPGHGLTRPVRLLHPRHRVYVVPRSARDVVVGASEIESEDRSPVSLRSAVELLAAAHSVVPALAEARILKMDVNLRPALPDNAPRIDHAPGWLRINGLFRHGWLLAPALVEQALHFIDPQAAALLAREADYEHTHTPA
ncbi:MAG: FAD-dependent oxidoreductase [Pseudomonadota bacterium]|nr:FAD-dependent oxidoreductase [Pseudomonadota bacterium]